MPNEAILEQIARRTAVVRESVRAVSQGYCPAFFLHGPAGHGKSHAVIAQLDDDPGPKKWIHHNSHVTAAALCEALYYGSDRVHLFEDCEHLYKDKIAAGLLRSACAATCGKIRLVTYETKRKLYRFAFDGGIIIVSNESLAKHGVLGAIASRFGPVNWRLSPEEIVAVIERSADSGYAVKGQQISAAECHEVAGFLTEQLDAAKQIDLRSYFAHALPAYCSWRNGNTTAHWTDVVIAKLQGEIQVERRDERLDRERLIARQCFDSGNDTIERLSKWNAATGKGKQAFYDRLNEAQANA